MRVLYLSNSSEIGGGNRSFLTLWKGLKGNGVAISVACPGEGPMVAACREVGIRCEPLAYGQPSWRQMVSSCRSYRQWRNLLSGFQADLVHANDLIPARCVALASWRLGLPLVCHVRFPPHPGLTRWVFRGLPKPDIFLFNSRALREDIGSDVARACPRSQQQVIYNAVDLEGFKPQSKRVGDPLRVGIIANLLPIKGHDDFIAMARTVIDRGYSCEFWVIGGDITHSGYQDYLTQLAAESGLGGRLQFLGFRHDVADLLNQLDILVSCSHNETFGRSLIEAMACGRPVVATAVGGVKEVVEDGKTGILVGPRDPGALACAVEQLLHNENLRAEMGRAGRARVEALFSTEAHVKQIMNVYESALGIKEKKRGWGRFFFAGHGRQGFVS